MTSLLSTTGRLMRNSKPSLVYLTLLMAGLMVMFVGAWWCVSVREIPVINQIIHLPLAGFGALALTGLLWLRPRRTPYKAGVLCILLAFTGFWLASPAGGLWTGKLLNDPNYGAYGGYRFGLLMLLNPAG